MPLIDVFNWANELRQLCIKTYTPWSTLIQNISLRGPASAGSIGSDQNHQIFGWSSHQNAALLLTLIIDNKCQLRKNEKKDLKKISSTNLCAHTSLSLVKLVCARIGLWSVYCALETASDQTVPDQSSLWSGKFQTIVQTKVRSKPFPDHVFRAHREHVCARRWSDRSLFRSGHLNQGSVVHVVFMKGQLKNRFYFKLMKTLDKKLKKRLCQFLRLSDLARPSCWWSQL